MQQKKKPKRKGRVKVRKPVIGGESKGKHIPNVSSRARKKRRKEK